MLASCGPGVNALRAEHLSLLMCELKVELKQALPDLSDEEIEKYLRRVMLDPVEVRRPESTMLYVGGFRVIVTIEPSDATGKRVREVLNGSHKVHLSKPIACHRGALLTAEELRREANEMLALAEEMS